MSHFVLALFIIGVGLSVAGMATHLYQGLSRQVAAFRFSGDTTTEAVLNLFVSFLCGPYMMLRLGFQTHAGGKRSTVDALLAAFIAFGWSFVTGLAILSTYISVVRIAA